MEYLSVSEVAKKWGVSIRQVQRLLADGRVPHSKKYGRSWMIPYDAEKPVDSRRKKKLPNHLISSEIAHVIETASEPMPRDNPDSILNMAKDNSSKVQYEAELAYMRGNFSHAMRCYKETKWDDITRVRASLVGVAAAISMGVYKGYKEIEDYLKNCIKEYKESGLSAIAQLALASVAVSVIAPTMVPEWLKDGDFTLFPPQASSTYMLYLRARYFLCVGKYETALGIAQTALVFSLKEEGITLSGIYLRVVCALACHYLKLENQTERWLLEAMRVALPHGFITPFAESVSELGGVVEQCLKNEFPEYFDAVIKQWEFTVKNWITFHNGFTKDNITLILSLREYHLAQMVARRVPYAQIAKQHNISVGRLKNIILEIHQKLFISSRDELAKYVLIIK